MIYSRINGERGPCRGTTGRVAAPLSKSVKGRGRAARFIGDRSRGQRTVDQATGAYLTVNTCSPGVYPTPIKLEHLILLPVAAGFDKAARAREGCRARRNLSSLLLYRYVPGADAPAIKLAIFTSRDSRNLPAPGSSSRDLSAVARCQRAGTGTCMEFRGHRLGPGETVNSLNWSCCSFLDSSRRSCARHSAWISSAAASSRWRFVFGSGFIERDLDSG